jgi:hypothetical protein
VSRAEFDMDICADAELLEALSSGGKNLPPEPPRGCDMPEDNSEPPDEGFDESVIILTAEEDALAELLADLLKGDFVRIIHRLSPEARDEIRAAIGHLQAKASFKESE